MDAADVLPPEAQTAAPICRSARRGEVKLRRRPRHLSRAARITVAAATVGAGLLTVGAQPAFASWQAAYTWTSVTLRDCYHPSKAAQPSTSCTAITLLPSNTNLHIICQHSGQTIDSDPVWDYVDTPYGQGYVTDAYVHSGYANWIPGVDVCNY